MTDAADQVGRKDCRMPIGYLVTTSLVACGVLSAGSDCVSHCGRVREQGLKPRPF